MSSSDPRRTAAQGGGPGASAGAPDGGAGAAPRPGAPPDGQAREPALELDHLVIAVRDLESGAAWCERTLGVTPGPGGRHPLMGTHNRLLALGSGRAGPGGDETWPLAYLELIAIDPQAAPPGRRRWFDLDLPALQAALAEGPQLVAWVARCTALDTALARWAADGLEGGRVQGASRETPAGLLRWRVAVRDDGARGAEGALPTLIAWDGQHPAAAMPPSGLVLKTFELAESLPAESSAPAALPARPGVPAPAFDVRHAVARAGGLPAITWQAAAALGAAFAVQLDTPRGPVRLAAPRFG